MAKKILFPVFGLMVLCLQFCTSAKKVQVLETPKKPVAITYNGHVKSLIISKCSPCHLSTGNEVSYDNYESAKENIEDIIRRVKRNPDEHGFMPQKAVKLSDSLIHVFEQWKVDSLLEK